LTIQTGSKKTEQIFHSDFRLWIYGLIKKKKANVQSEQYLTCNI